MEVRMQRVGLLLVVLVLLAAIPSFAQSSTASAPPTKIAGSILSFSGNILDVKPPNAPAVWVTIPANLKVDRDALKPDTKVSVEAYWADVCYVATQVTVQK
jgi:hypothetical protein